MGGRWGEQATLRSQSCVSELLCRGTRSNLVRVRQFSRYLCIVLIMSTGEGVPVYVVQAADQPAHRAQLVNQSCPSSGIRVAVFANGTIQVNGAPVKLPQFASVLGALAAGATAVCLHRQNPDAPEPHPNMLKVLDAVIALKLPVAFYWDPGFQKRVSFK
jgi:hypothetical protein